MEMLTSEAVLRILRESRDEARLRYKAELRGIFGSVAVGTSGQASDVDVLVDFEETANLIDFMGLAIFLEEKFQYPVDVVPEKAIRKELKSQILNQAIYI
jgi:uncharacterized protein